MGLPQEGSLRIVSTQSDPSVIAAITVVGTEALFGDVTVAAAVISPAVDSVIRIDESCSDDGYPQVELWTLDESQKLASYSPEFSKDRSTILFRPVGRTTPHPSSNRKLFSVVAKMVDFSLVAGFTPESASDLSARVDKVVDRLSATVLYRYPEASLAVFGDHAVELPRLWASLLKSKNIFPHFGVADNNVFIGQAVRLQVAAFAAEFLATGVRTARARDLAEIYPFANLDNNLGYPTDRGEMLSAVGPLTKTLKTGRGIRFGMIEQWQQWVAANPVVDGETEEDDEDETGSKTFRARKPYKDAQGRDCVKFDVRRAKQLSDQLFVQLNGSSSARWTDWKRQFVQSIHDQLESGRRLSDRQMYCLERLDT